MEKKHGTHEYDFGSVESNSISDTSGCIDHKEEFTTNPRQEIPVAASGRGGFFKLRLPEVSVMELPDGTVNQKPEAVTSVNQRNDISPSAERVVEHTVNRSCEGISDEVNSSKKVELPIDRLGNAMDHPNTETSEAHTTSPIQADGEHLPPVEHGSQLTKPNYVNDSDCTSPTPHDADDNPLSLLEELQFAVTHKPDVSTEDTNDETHDHDNSICQFDSLHVSAVQRLKNYISGSGDTTSNETTVGDNSGVTEEPFPEKSQRRPSQIASIPFELLHDSIICEDIQTKTSTEDDDSENKNSQPPENEEVQKFIAELYENERKADTKLKHLDEVEAHPKSQGHLKHAISGQKPTPDNQTTNRRSGESLEDIPVDGKSHDHTCIANHVVSEVAHESLRTSAGEGLPDGPEPAITAERDSALHDEPPKQLVYVHGDPGEINHGANGQRSVTLEQCPHPEQTVDPPDSLHNDDSQVAQEPPKLACHVCTDLIPLIQRISRQIARLESLPLRREEERLREDVDKVFTCLYEAIDAREADLLQAVDGVYGREDTAQEQTLLDEIQNANSYCEKTLSYSTKPELLELSTVILYHADELLIKGVTVTPDSGVDADFADNNIRGVVEEVEEFGKVFNVKDVDDAVRNKSFPKEHTSSEGEEGISDVADGLQPPLPLGDPLMEDVLPPGPNYESLSAEEQQHVSQA